jgi:WD40 repeat protein
MGMSEDRRYILTTLGEVSETGGLFSVQDSDLVLFDLESGDRSEIMTHGRDVQTVAVHAGRRLIVTGDSRGVVRAGPMTGEEPHLLLSFDQKIWSVSISQDGEWIFATSGSEIRRWPTPDLSEPPLHTLPREELLERLRSMTNLRVVEDRESLDGWSLEVGPFASPP